MGHRASSGKKITVLKFIFTEQRKSLEKKSPVLEVPNIFAGHRASLKKEPSFLVTKYVLLGRGHERYFVSIC